LYDQGSQQFVVTSTGVHSTLPGNFNGDDVVNASDYVAWRKTPGASDGYNAWRVNFGETASSGSAASGTVPEPATALLLPIAAWVFFRRRKFCS
jgi:hypothetical protein